ncbi:unannotated protein [freshwater metagenome]|uniref:Unannotated protein n=1 Tax=freshwater metagenome TaxID=449393 RepID=A0A6J7VUD0_9ZZZZ
MTTLVAERTTRVMATGKIEEYSISKKAPFGSLGALHFTVAALPTTVTLSTLALTTGVAASAAGKKLDTKARRHANETFLLYFTVGIVLYRINFLT